MGRCLKVVYVLTEFLSVSSSHWWFFPAPVIPVVDVKCSFPVCPKKISPCLTLCVVAQSCLTLCGPSDCSTPGSSVRGILRQEHWSGLPCPPPGDLPHPGLEPRSHALQVGSLLTESPGNALIYISIDSFYIYFIILACHFNVQIALQASSGILWHASIRLFLGDEGMRGQISWV